MTREWQPGDVADVTQRGNVRAFRTDKGWTYVDGSTQGPDADRYDFRPLLVIDPEEESLQIAHALWETFESIGTRDFRVWDRLIRDVLRSLMPQSKPDEPTGLGAVIETDDGRKFIRTVGRDSRFPWVNADDPGKNAFNWESHGGLDGSRPIRVLSEGVTP